MLCRERKAMRVERKDEKEREWNVKNEVSGFEIRIYSVREIFKKCSI